MTSVALLNILIYIYFLICAIFIYLSSISCLGHGFCVLTQLCPEQYFYLFIFVVVALFFYYIIKLIKI